MSGSDPIQQPNAEMIKRYFDVVFGYTEGLMPLRPITENGTPQLLTPQWLPSTSDGVEKCIKFAEACTQSKAAFYVIPGTVRRAGQAKADHIYQMQAVMVDLDFGDIDAKVKHLIHYLKTPTLVVESGGITPEGQKKKHIYFQLQEAYYESEDLTRIKRLREVMALKAGGDEHFKSLHQPIRVAGSIYHKGGALKLVTIIESNIYEHDVKELLERAEDMPSFDLKRQSGSLHHQKNRKGAKLSIDEIMITQFREGDVDELSRYQALSKIIGYWIRRFHEGRSSLKEAWREIKGFNQARIVAPWETPRLMKETRALWAKHTSKYGPPKAPAPDPIVQFKYLKERTCTFKKLVTDQTPTPDDLISPRILPPGEVLVLGGAPKTGKSDLLLHLLVHMASGLPFLSFHCHRPLRVFYLQTEVGYHYLKERIQSSILTQPQFKPAGSNLVVTERLRLMLNEEGVESVVRLIQTTFSEPPDILAFDPLRNLFDGGPEGKSSENDNGAMMHFLTQRIEGIQKAINPQAGIIIAHHTRKMDIQALFDNPFEAFAGASSLRGFYSSGLILCRPHETKDDRVLFTELRNGPDIGMLSLHRGPQGWQLGEHSPRCVAQEQGRRLDKERLRRNDVIISILRKEALKKRFYFPSRFAAKFENKYDLGSKDAIQKRLDVLITKGYIKFFKNAADYHLKSPTSKFGYMCVEDMVMGPLKADVDPQTGEITQTGRPILPTHYRCSQTARYLDEKHPEVWTYED